MSEQRTQPPARPAGLTADLVVMALRRLLAATRAQAALQVKAAEDARASEMRSHARRIEEVRGHVSKVLDQLKRARLDVDEWTR